MDPGLGELIGDERKFKQILVNLLSNALKFTPDGGRVAVMATPADGSAGAPGMVEIAVSDTGVGIAPADQATISEEFRQVGSGAQNREGTGPGLTLTRKFIGLGVGLWSVRLRGCGAAGRS